MLVCQQQSDGGDTEPVQPAEVQAEADGAEQDDRRNVQHPRSPERAPNAEPDSDRVQTLLEINLAVEERVKEVEPCDPDRDGRAERPRLPRQATGDRDPGAHRREAVDSAEPEMAEPGEALEVGVDDEADERDRPKPAHDRLEREAREQVEAERQPTERRYLRPRQP